ncbi:hypothetical protein ACO0LC_20035 [Undibacterium sp. JH2W]|uniref:hypothetical protein n=1 Tax=Undibacterium sp. JH2W TaxID=3413037 RepID=UPI003BF1EB53
MNNKKGYLVNLFAVATLSILLSTSASSTAAEIPDHVRVKAAVDALFPEEQFNVWEFVKGDLNGDGIDDFAAVLTSHREEGERGERLVILAGQKNGSYTVLAASDDFCRVRYHYNLEIQNKSLLVTGYANLHGSNFSLQFRYNSTRKDLELIGENHIDSNDEERSFYRQSINYATDKIILSRKKNKLYKEVEIKMVEHRLAGLQGFNCRSYSDGIKELQFYINEDFSFKQW